VLYAIILKSKKLKKTLTPQAVHSKICNYISFLSCEVECGPDVIL
jgi:hypothetical protein